MPVFATDNSQSASLKEQTTLASSPPSSGTWVVSDTTLIQNMTLIINGSIVIASGGNLTLNGSTILMNCPSDDAYNITVRDGGNLRIINSTVKAYTNYAWYLDADTGSSLEITDQSTIWGAGQGEENLVAASCDNLVITNSTLGNQYRYHVLWIGGADNAYVVNNTICDSSYYGIRLTNSLNATIMNNTIEDTSNMAMYIMSGCDGFKLIGNRIRNIGSSGIWVQSDYVNISYNIFENIGKRVMWLDYLHHSNVTGNVINNAGGTGIYLRGPDDYHLIQGNIINDTTSHGIDLLLDSAVSERLEYVTVTGNIVNNTQDTAISLLRCRYVDIYLNSFQSNSTHTAVVDSLSSSISWDNTTYGNSWLGYNGTDGDLDGIGDAVWNITADKTHQDNYPLMNDSLAWDRLGEFVYSPPEITSLILTPDEPTSSNDVTVRLTAESDYTIREVLFGWEIAPAGEIFSWHPMNLVGDEWNFTIPAQSTGTTVEYAAKVMSGAGEWTEIEMDSYDVVDDVAGPDISSITRDPVSPTNLEDVTVEAEVTDLTEVDTVILSYTTDSESWTNLTMEEDSSIYSGVIPAQPADTQVYYKILANDTLGNWDNSTTFSYIVELYDVTGPDISVDIQPSEPTDDDNVTVSATASDVSGVDEVIVSYKVETDGIWINLTTSLESGSYTAEIPSQDYQAEVFYKVYASDSKDNWNTTEVASYTVKSSDQEAPSVTYSLKPENPTTADDVWVYATITDDSSVIMAYLCWSPDEGTTWYNVSMGNYMDDIWRGNTGMHPAGQEILFKFYAWDLYNNVEVTEEYSFSVTQSTDGGLTTTFTTTPDDGFELGTTELIIIGVGVFAVIVVIVAIVKRK